MSNSSGTDPFIISTTSEKPSASTRKFIRSHVMRGKNTRSDVRARRRARLEESILSLHTAQEKSSEEEEVEWTLKSPRNITSELFLYAYGYLDDMKPYMIDLIQRAFTIVKPSTYTIEIQLVEGTTDNLYCLSNLPQYPAMVHSLLFTAQAFHDLSRTSSYGEIAQFHLAKTLWHLQQSINSSDEARKTSTMAVVTMLATAAAILGDLETAEKHIRGLHQIVEFCGGLKTLEQNRMVMHKAQRIDLGLAMAAGSKTRFFGDNFSWGPQFAQGKAVRVYPELGELGATFDPRLLNIWVDLREFSKTVGHAVENHIKMPAGSFSMLNSSIPYRLLHLQFHPGSLSELLRLSMLAYVKSILIKIPGIGKKMSFLAKGLEGILLAQEYPPRPQSAGLLLWALFVATVSIFEGFDRTWVPAALLQTISSLGLQTWTETRKVLKSFLWIEIVFDQAGETIFESLFLG